jgi:SAM-dependent methyltransferase
MQGSYRYPDPGDRLTAATIRAVGFGISEWRRQEAEILNRFAVWLATQSPRRRLLDYGSGEGRVSARFATLFERVTAYEPDDQRRAIHAQRIGGDDSNVELLASFNQVAAAATFDAAICSHVIQHITRDAADAVLADLASALRPGGALLLLTTSTWLAGWDTPRYVLSWLSAKGPAVESEVDAVEFDTACRKNTLGKLPIHFFSMRELLDALNRHSFRVVEAYGLHGNVGVVGPIDLTSAAPSRQPSEASSGDTHQYCRDVAIFATRWGMQSIL